MNENLSLRRSALQKANCVITTNNHLKKTLEHIVSKEKIKIVKNSVDDIDQIKNYQQGIIKAYPPEILFVGMLNYNKGPQLLVNILEDLCERLTDFRIVFAGRGYVESEIINKAKELNILDRLILPGYLGREELFRCYARSTVVVCPSLWVEPFGRVPLEAGISARPVIATNRGGYI